MDAFFAAVEQRDHPELRGKPVLVGGDPKGRGVVSTASYEARPFGCGSAMPMAQAVRLCPDAIIVRPSMTRYSEASAQVFSIFEHYTPKVEPLSIDEAFLDVTGSTRLLGPAEKIARELKQRIQEETQLTASIGVASNKFLAKLASDQEKPDGLVVVQSDAILAFLDPLPVSRLWGVGKATLPKLERLGVQTFADLRRHAKEELRQHFGDTGERFYRLVRGIDDRDVITDRQAKSISHEVTFSVDVNDEDHLRRVLLHHTEGVARRLRRHGRVARTVSIKVRTSNFATVTRSLTLTEGTDETDTLWRSASTLFQPWWSKHELAVRLIGMAASNLTESRDEQLALFDATDDRRDTRQLDQAVDEIRNRYGNGAIERGTAMTPDEK